MTVGAGTRFVRVINSRSLLIMCITTSIVLAACTSTPNPAPDAPTTTVASPTLTTGANEMPTTTAEPRPPTTAISSAPSTTLAPDQAPDRPAGCPDPGQPVDQSGPSAQTVVLELADDGTPLVEAVVYPHPSYEGVPWSQWGQGLVLEDGRFLSAIGDHRGADGNAYVYQFDPATGSLTQVTDVLSLVDHTPGAWGYGKIHAQMVRGRCGEVFLATYWGSRRGLTYDGGYSGDWLLRWDPSTHSITPLDIPASNHGIPSLAGWSTGGLLFGEAVDPSQDGDHGLFFVYDIEDGEVVLSDADTSHTGFRSVLVDAAGRAYFSAGASRLHVFDPGTKEIQSHPEALPGDWLRAATRPAADGTVYGVTRDPEVLFALEPDGTIRTLGLAGGYTTSLALSADETTLYYVPGAHGDSWEQGTPVIAVDVATGEQATLVELNEMAEDELNLRLGGTYNVAADPTGRYLYIGFNSGPAGEDSFGEVVLVVVHLR